MADTPSNRDESNFAVIFDPENGFQLLDVDNDQVADLAVLETTWRQRNSPLPTSAAVTPDELSTFEKNLTEGSEAAPAHGSLVEKATPQRRLETIQYGALRIRSMGRSPYNIADPGVSLRDNPDT